ncbi:DUF421 domain-containing protein [Clostridium swellfunianum]|uniref:DUF421 domain-containing protein n=1 Tax=Clostridium swellfunianum TaxID=1367462 RepID=UPI00202F1173|nr:DUF421 domain-containing protein [Clostridium swellfunianum]MCM0650096.1 DUF421 domain-containing protein [Clostridium swellfunianum]
MGFFQSQETLTAVQWALRAMVGFFFLVIVAKVLGQRSISQLRLLDFVVALVIGNMVAHPLSDEHLGMEGSLICTAVIVALYLGGIFMILRWPRFRRLLNQKPVILVQNGEILDKGLKKARISIDILLEELREQKVKDVKTVAIAFWEADGKISFFLDPRYENVTNEALQIKTEPLDFPRIVIKEGIINYKELKQIGKDEVWVVSNVKRLYHTEVKNVLLASLDRRGNMTVFLYK